jgi:hypothetical protein
MYATPYHKTGPTTYAGDGGDNYILGAKLETVVGPTFSGWDANHANMTFLEGSDN